MLRPLELPFFVAKLTLSYDNQNTASAVPSHLMIYFYLVSEQQGPKDKYKGHNHPFLRQETFFLLVPEPQNWLR